MHWYGISPQNISVIYICNIDSVYVIHCELIIVPIILTVRSCTAPPPEPWLGMDLDWPQKKSLGGSKVTYVCPYKKMTHLEMMIGME